MKKVALSLLLFPILSFADDITVENKAVVFKSETSTITFPPKNKASGLDTTTGFKLTVPEGKVFNAYNEDDYKGAYTSYKEGTYNNVILRSLTVAGIGGTQYPDTSDFGESCFSSLKINSMGDFIVTVDQTPREVTVLMKLANITPKVMNFNVQTDPATLMALGDSPESIIRQYRDKIKTDYWINLNDRAKDLPVTTDWRRPEKLTVKAGEEFFAQFDVNIAKYKLKDINTVTIMANTTTSMLSKGDVNVSIIEAFCK